MAHQQNLTPGAGVYKEEPTSVAGDPVSTVNYPYPYLDSYPTCLRAYYLLPCLNLDPNTSHTPPTQPNTPTHYPHITISLLLGTLCVLFHTCPCPKVFSPKLFSLHLFYSLVLHHPASSLINLRATVDAFLSLRLPCLTERKKKGCGRLMIDCSIHGMLHLCRDTTQTLTLPNAKMTVPQIPVLRCSFFCLCTCSLHYASVTL